MHKEPRVYPDIADEHTSKAFFPVSLSVAGWISLFPTSVSKSRIPTSYCPVYGGNGLVMGDRLMASMTKSAPAEPNNRVFRNTCPIMSSVNLQCEVIAAERTTLQDTKRGGSAGAGAGLRWHERLSAWSLTWATSRWMTKVARRRR